MPQLEAMGILAQADQLALETLCITYAAMRRKPTAALIGRFQSLLGEFGLTPSARARIRLPEKAPSGYGDFRRGGPAKPGDGKS